MKRNRWVFRVFNPLKAFAQMEIKIFKHQKKMNVYQNKQLFKSYPIGIGKNEIGHKFEEGDHKTPEGIYQICVKNPKSKFYLSVGLNYPNQRDAKIAYQLARITKEEHEKIIEANDNHQIPPWDTRLGGAIYIHGELEKQQWSEGCIRMYNKDIEELYPLLEKGVSVLVYA